MAGRPGDGRGLQPAHQHVALVPAAEPAPRSAVAGVVGGRLVVAGGLVLALTSVEAHTPTGGPARSCRTLFRPRRVLNGRLYVWAHQCNKLQVLQYSEENDFGRPRPTAGRGWSAGDAVVDGKLWLCGGRVWSPTIGIETTATVVVYDFQKDSWATGPALPHAIGFCSAAVCDGEVRVTGCADHSAHPIGFVYRGERWVELPHASGAPCGQGSGQFLLLG